MNKNTHRIVPIEAINVAIKGLWENRAHPAADKALDALIETKSLNSDAIIDAVEEATDTLRDIQKDLQDVLDGRANLNKALMEAIVANSMEALAAYDKAVGGV